MQQTQIVVGTPVGIQVSASSSNAPPRPAPLERRATMSKVLMDKGWPPGLTHSVATSVEAFPVRIVVVDNSGSMNRMDGTRLVRLPNGDVKSIKATRWAELSDTVLELGEVVSSLRAETHFHLLNPMQVGQYFVVADDGLNPHIAKVGAPADVGTLRRVMDTSPMSSTPLTEAVQTCIAVIAPAADKLRAQGQQVVVVLATDGLPNDPHSFLNALQQLQQLPVWLVVRLCTDEDDVVEYWSDLDAQLEAPLETLDDVGGEAKEVYRANPWITYAPSLHLARTMGLQDKLFDLLDEKPLYARTRCARWMCRTRGTRRAIATPRASPCVHARARPPIRVRRPCACAHRLRPPVTHARAGCRRSASSSSRGCSAAASSLNRRLTRMSSSSSSRRRCRCSRPCTIRSMGG